MATTSKTRKQIKVTIPAKKHIEKIVEHLKAQGRAGVSETVIVSDAILALPLPEEKQDQAQPIHQGG